MFKCKIWQRRVFRPLGGGLVPRGWGWIFCEPAKLGVYYIGSYTARIVHVLHAMTQGKRLCVYLNAKDHATLEARMRESGLSASRVFAHLLQRSGRMSMQTPQPPCPSVQAIDTASAADREGSELDGLL